MGPKRANVSWCLRREMKGQNASLPAVRSFCHLATVKRRWKVFATSGASSRHHRECMRRALVQAEENKTAISDLTQRVNALHKSMDDVAHLSFSVDTLQGQMSNLMQWNPHRILEFLLSSLGNRRHLRLNPSACRRVAWMPSFSRGSQKQSRESTRPS